MRRIPPLGTHSNIEPLLIPHVAVVHLYLYPIQHSFRNQMSRRAYSEDNHSRVDLVDMISQGAVDKVLA